jgi:hypothetical protein
MLVLPGSVAIHSRNRDAFSILGAKNSTFPKRSGNIAISLHAFDSPGMASTSCCSHSDPELSHQRRTLSASRRAKSFFIFAEHLANCLAEDIADAKVDAPEDAAAIARCAMSSKASTSVASWSADVP